MTMGLVGCSGAEALFLSVGLRGAQAPLSHGASGICVILEFVAPSAFAGEGARATLSFVLRAVADRSVRPTQNCHFELAISGQSWQRRGISLQRQRVGVSFLPRWRRGISKRHQAFLYFSRRPLLGTMRPLRRRAPWG